MFLYLVQHAEAKREEEDPARGLTEKGLNDIRKVAEYAAKLNIITKEIFHSGKTRAQQTARVLSDFLRPEKGISQTDGLSPMGDPEVWFGRVSKMEADIMLVSHLPFLSKLASLLLCGDKEKNVVNFKMGCIVCLKRFEDGRWAVEWMIVPEVV
jgi:phosphohistidine phosphatase